MGLSDLFGAFDQFKEISKRTISITFDWQFELLGKDIHVRFLEIGKIYGDVFSISIGIKVSHFQTVSIFASVLTQYFWISFNELQNIFNLL